MYSDMLISMLPFRLDSLSSKNIYDSKLERSHWHPALKFLEINCF